MTQSKTIPFDMEEILLAIESNSYVKDIHNQYAIASQKLEQKKEYISPILFSIQANEGNLLMTNAEIENHIKYMLRRLPENTLNRKHLSAVSLLDTHWFRNGATYENLFDSSVFPQGPLTTNKLEAASEFSLPWGMNAYVDNNPYKSMITMYLPIDTNDHLYLVLDLYFIYTLFHEIGHVFSDAAYYSLYYAKKFLGIDNLADKRNAYTLTLPNGDQISGNEYVASFAALIEKHGPFGQYTAGYRKEDDEELWLRESFADATAAYFTGFMMYPEKNFASLHPEVQQYMHDFYHAVATITKT